MALPANVRHLSESTSDWIFARSLSVHATGFSGAGYLSTTSENRGASVDETREELHLDSYSMHDLNMKIIQMGASCSGPIPDGYRKKTLNFVARFASKVRSRVCVCLLLAKIIDSHAFI